MLTLITGGPGAGKTAYAVARLQEFVQANPSRPVFVMGIPDLLVPHELTPPVDQWVRTVTALEDESIVQSEFAFPEGALVVIDEAQKVFRPRGVGSKVPAHVAAFETHRHQGLDFWLITQHPNLIDSNIRKLVRKHVHLRQHWAGRELLEWSEAADPGSRSDRDVAVRRPYRLPKGVFGQYKSASMHVQTRQRLPVSVWVFLGILAIVGVLGWQFYGRVSGAIRGDPAVAAAQKPAAVVSGSGASLQRNGSAGALRLEDFEPRLRGRPESAPLYDDLREVVALPAVVGCVHLRGRCSCYTGQGTDAGFDQSECLAWLRAPPFSPFREPWPAPPKEVSRISDPPVKTVTP